MIHGPNIPGSYAILLFTASDLASITSHIHSWSVVLAVALSLPGVISPLISHSILDTYRPREFIFHCPVFLRFQAVHGVLKARILKWFAFPSLLDHVLSELSIMTCPSWMALHGMAHRFIELDKVRIHVISLVTFL